VARADSGVTPLDYTHQADVWFDHSFDTTLKLNLRDSLIVAQDPQLVQGGAVQRVEGNNLNNVANATISKEWTRQFSTATHYQNNLVLYSDSTVGPPTPANPSNAAVLNRMEQSIGTDFQWEFQPQTMGLIGYQYSWVHYTGGPTPGYIAISQPNPSGSGPLLNYLSSSRDYRAHYFYVGGSHVFSPNISGQAKVGASYVDSYNAPTGASKSWAPYADISATYTYVPGSYVQAGFHQDISATSESASASNNGQLTQYQQTSTAYLDWTHKFDQKITGTVIGQYVYSSFKDGPYNGQPENTVDVGVNLNYMINRHFYAEAGYNFDELFSNVSSRGYSRNRVYFGLGASY
jgi:hypothetical protein